FVHYRKRAMGAGPDNESLASPGNFFPGRNRRVAELFAELFGRSFLPFPHFAAIDHYIMRVALALDLDLAKFDQSCFYTSMFRPLELQGKRQDSNGLAERHLSHIRCMNQSTGVCRDFLSALNLKFA